MPQSLGARVALATHFADGGRGAVELAGAVVEACSEPSSFAYAYPLEATLKDKIAATATRVYGAAGVSDSTLAERHGDHALHAPRRVQGFIGVAGCRRWPRRGCRRQA